MLNCTTIIGRLVADIELKSTQSGVSVASFTVAVDRDYVKAGEQRQADFIDIVAWRNTAEFAANYFRKGSFIAIQGALQTRSYEDKNGNKRKAVEIVAEKISFCGAKAHIDVEDEPKQNAQQYESGNDFESIPNDELPF